MEKMTEISNQIAGHQFVRGSGRKFNSQVVTQCSYLYLPLQYGSTVGWLRGMPKYAKHWQSQRCCPFLPEPGSSLGQKARRSSRGLGGSEGSICLSFPVNDVGGASCCALPPQKSQLSRSSHAARSCPVQGGDCPRRRQWAAQRSVLVNAVARSPSALLSPVSPSCCLWVCSLSTLPGPCVGFLHYSHISLTKKETCFKFAVLS